MVVEITSSDAVLLANMQSALYDRCIYAYTRRSKYLDKRPGRGREYLIYRLRIKRKSNVIRFLVKVGLRHPKHLKNNIKLLLRACPAPCKPPRVRLLAY